MFGEYAGRTGVYAQRTRPRLEREGSPGTRGVPGPEEKP